MQIIQHESRFTAAESFPLLEITCP